METLQFRAPGKLLLTAEYFVLDGATALAVPTLPGQRMTVTPVPGEPCLYWKSVDADGSPWFEAVFTLPEIAVRSTTDDQVAITLRQLLSAIRQWHPGFLTGEEGVEVTTILEFPRNWGLGSSSTLIYMLSQWSGVDPYLLLAATMGGSGYDIACAAAGSPLLYTLKQGMTIVKPVPFKPVFSHQLYFVYLGKKQNSREGIARYRSIQADRTAYAERFSVLTIAFLCATDLATFDSLIREHEQWVASLLGLTRAKHLYFSDFSGEVKSLGAWGGDFVLVTSDRPEQEVRAYFAAKGMDVFLRYEELVMGGAPDRSGKPPSRLKYYR